jgi:hypothetical protein
MNLQETTGLTRAHDEVQERLNPKFFESSEERVQVSPSESRVFEVEFRRNCERVVVSRVGGRVGVHGEIEEEEQSECDLGSTATAADARVEEGSDSEGSDVSGERRDE